MTSRRARLVRRLMAGATFVALAAMTSWYLLRRPTSDELLPENRERAARNSERLRASWERTESLLGVIVPRQTAEVASRIDGRIVEVYVELGEQVEEGQLLAKLDEGALPEEIAIAKAKLRAARSERQRAALELDEALGKRDRRRSLNGIVSTEEMSSANTKAGIAKVERGAAAASVSEGKTEIQRLEKTLSETELRAPFSGLVASIYEAKGNFVTPGTPVVRVNSSDLWLRFAGPPAVMASLERGTEVEFAPKAAVDNSPPSEAAAIGQAAVATIRNIAPEVDPASQMITAEAELGADKLADSSLRPGVLVQVRPLPQQELKRIAPGKR